MSNWINFCAYFLPASGFSSIKQGQFSSHTIVMRITLMCYLRPNHMLHWMWKYLSQYQAHKRHLINIFIVLFLGPFTAALPSLLAWISLKQDHFFNGFFCTITKLYIRRYLRKLRENHFLDQCLASLDSLQRKFFPLLSVAPQDFNILFLRNHSKLQQTHQDVVHW
jgi:hypothetical protein